MKTRIEEIKEEAGSGGTMNIANLDVQITSKHIGATGRDTFTFNDCRGFIIALQENGTSDSPGKATINTSVAMQKTYCNDKLIGNNTTLSVCYIDASGVNNAPVYVDYFGNNIAYVIIKEKK